MNTPNSDLEALHRDALREVINEDSISPALVQLQETATDAVFRMAVDSCQSPEPQERLLGCRILRELGTGWGRPFAEPASTVLRSLLASETSTHVLEAALDALGWQGLSSNRDILLGYLGDPNARLRDVVASNITSVADVAGDAGALTALLRLANDADADVRASAIWALAEEIPHTLRGVRRALMDATTRVGERTETVSVAKDALATADPERKPG